MPTVVYGSHHFHFPVRRLCPNGITAEHDAGRFYELDLLEDSIQHCTGVVVDVGANLGNHTVFWAGVCRAQVIAIEPDENLGELLLEAVELNTGKLNPLLRVYPLVCGDGSRVRPIVHPLAPEQTIGNRCYIADPVGPLPTTSLSEMLPGEDVSLIKIDVEGMELAVLHGAYALIHRCHPAVYAEALDHQSFHDIDAWMGGVGYKMVAAFGKTYKWVTSST